jgi:23S rRNA pseudouridine1911/1915/1917 synthase
VVADKPKVLSDTLTHYLKKDEKKNMSRAYDEEVKGSSKSSLDYYYISSSQTYHLLEINPHTGRHHQIRAQLSKMGCPIKGDVKYGSKRTNPDGSIHLHARKIEFEHPVKKEPVIIEAAPPNEVVWNALTR